jgi:hypothetical protein
VGPGGWGVAQDEPLQELAGMTGRSASTRPEARAEERERAQRLRAAALCVVVQAERPHDLPEDEPLLVWRLEAAHEHRGLRGPQFARRRRDEQAGQRSRTGSDAAPAEAYPSAVADMAMPLEVEEPLPQLRRRVDPPHAPAAADPAVNIASAAVQPDGGQRDEAPSAPTAALGLGSASGRAGAAAVLPPSALLAGASPSRTWPTSSAPTSASPGSASLSGEPASSAAASVALSSSAPASSAAPSTTAMGPAPLASAVAPAAPSAPQGAQRLPVQPEAGRKVAAGPLPVDRAYRVASERLLAHCGALPAVVVVTEAGSHTAGQGTLVGCLTDLAAALAAATHEPVLLVDACFDGNGLTHRFDQAGAFGLGELLLAKRAARQVCLDTAVAGVRLLPRGLLDERQWFRAAPERFAEVAAELRASHRLVLVHLAAETAPYARYFLQAADATLLAASLLRTTRPALLRAVQHLQRAAAPRPACLLLDAA